MTSELRVETPRASLFTVFPPSTWSCVPVAAKIVVIMRPSIFRAGYHSQDGSGKDARKPSRTRVSCSSRVCRRAASGRAPCPWSPCLHRISLAAVRSRGQQGLQISAAQYQRTGVRSSFVAGRSALTTEIMGKRKHTAGATASK